MMTMTTTTNAMILPSLTTAVFLLSMQLHGASAIPRIRRQQSASGAAPVPCLTADDCRAKYDVLVSTSVINGYFYADPLVIYSDGTSDNTVREYYPYEGCVLKGNNVYFGNGGTIEQMSSILYGEKQRLWCDETMPIRSTREEGDTISSMSMGLSDMSMIQNEMSMSMMGGGGDGGVGGGNIVLNDMSMSVPPLETNQMDMTTTSSPSVAPDIAATACEIGTSADPTKSCPDDEFCQLEYGTCNSKMSVHVGACVAVPQVCTLDYNPVCGCDQITYANECSSFSSGISISRTGECDVSGGTAGDVSTTNDTATSAIDVILDDVVNATDATADAVTDYFDNVTIPTLGNYTGAEGDGDTKMESTSSSEASYAPGRVAAIVTIIVSVVVYGGNWL